MPKRRVPIKTTATIAAIAMAAVFGIVLPNLGHSIAQNQQASQNSVEQFQAKWDQREKAVKQFVSTDPQITKYTKGAIAVDSDFYPAAVSPNNTDTLNTHIFKTRSVVGDYKTGYTVTYGNHTELAITLVGNSTTGVKVTQSPDAVYTIAYSPDKQAIINLALQNPSVQKLLSNKDWYVRHIHTAISLGSQCPYGSCNSIIFDQNQRQESVVAFINNSTNTVTDVKSTPGW